MVYARRGAGRLLDGLDRLSRGLRQRALKTAGVGVGLAVCVTLSGCAGFFVYPGSTTTTTTGTGTGTSSSDDYAYVSNSTTGSTYLNGYVVSAGTLTAATGSPYSLGFSPEAMAITPSDGLMYIASDSELSTGYLYGYTIGAGGALTILDGGTALESESIASLAISPDGQWLFALDTDGITLEEYGINSSTGALTYETTYGIAGAVGETVTPAEVTVAPSGNLIVCALGQGGMITFSFDTSTGVATEAGLTTLGSADEGIYTVAVDSNNNIYAAGTVGLQVFTTSTAGVALLVNSTPYATGNGPRSMVVSSGNSYVYTGNQTDGTITEDSIATGATGPVLTAITGSPVAAPTDLNALGRDNSGSYILAAGYNGTSGVQLYTIGSTGALTESASEPTGTSVLIPTVVAMTH